MNKEGSHERRPVPRLRPLFFHPEGERVLAHLKAVTLDRALGPDSSDALLRHLEGQRQLVASILAQIERGRTAPQPTEPDGDIS